MARPRLSLNPAAPHPGAPRLIGPLGPTKTQVAEEPLGPVGARTRPKLQRPAPAIKTVNAEVAQKTDRSSNRRRNGAAGSNAGSGGRAAASNPRHVGLEVA